MIIPLTRNKRYLNLYLLTIYTVLSATSIFIVRLSFCGVGECKHMNDWLITTKCSIFCKEAIKNILSYSRPTYQRAVLSVVPN